MHGIYLDHNATTPVDPRVLEVMLPYFTEDFGNAASRNHAAGRQAREAVEQARSQVAQLIGCLPEEVVWTSGATESNNLALLGVAEAYPERGRHLITSPVEHKAVLDPCRVLARRGHLLTVLPISASGRVDPVALTDALRPDTLLVSLMFANNELGTLNPVAELGQLCHARGVLFHCDGAQAVGKVPVDVEAQHIDLLSLSGHKLHGPKGVGALYVRSNRPRVKLRGQLHGGGHELGLRSGTLNVPGIVGLGRACELAGELLAEEAIRLTRLRDRLWEGLSAQVAGVVRHGSPEHVLPSTLNLRFDGVPAELVLRSIGEELAISSGSACTTSSLEPSYVIRALGLGDAAALGSLRFSLGRFTTAAEIEQTIDRLAQVVPQLRAAFPALTSPDPELSHLFD